MDYEEGLPLSILNADEFTKEDVLVIKQIIEPAIINTITGNAIRIGLYWKKPQETVKRRIMFIGIDLGTTNSSITSFDGKETRIWKSPEQNDVTPSVIYINKRGGKMYGQSAYNNEPRDPKNTAKLFKRYMGTNTKNCF